MEFRPYYLAQEWVRAGHEVTIIAGTPSHLRQENPTPAASNPEQWIDGIRYHWITLPSYSRNGVRRAFNVYAFAWRLTGMAKEFADRFSPDAVIASSTHPLDIVGARRIARRSRATLVFEVHDLWPLTLIEVGGMSAWHPFAMHLQWAEDAAYRWADRVVSILPHAKDHMIGRGMDPSKFAYIPNGFRVAEWADQGASRPSPALVRRTEEGRRRDRFQIGYAGGHGLANALDDLLSAAEILRDQPVDFTLIGGGPEKHRLIERARSLRLENVAFLDPIPKHEIPAALRQFDALYLGWEPKPIYRFGTSPNKLIDYFMAARPIVHAHVGENDSVAIAGAGVSVPAGNPSAIAAGIEALRLCSRKDREVMGQQGRAFAEQHHDYAVLAARFIECLPPRPTA